MKKFLSVLICTVVLVVSSIGFVACENENGDSSGDLPNESVNLLAITGEQVGVMDNVDYYVVPEPAASAKVNALKTLNFVGDLQKIYGGENGYPQAVIVAKNDFIADNNFVKQFLNAVEKNREWILNENTSAETVVTAVSEHLTEGMSPTFTAKNLTKDVIKNCGINLTYSYSDSGEIKNFIEKLNSVSETGFGTPADKFFHNGNYGSAEYSGKVDVYLPDGAPALGIANLLAGAETFSDNIDIKYNIVDPTLIQTYVAGASPKADICVLPVNLAVKLLGSGEKYSLVGTLTHGNLFMVSNSSTQITAENLGVLKGKTVGVVNLPAVPGLTFKLLLKNNGLTYKELV